MGITVAERPAYPGPEPPAAELTSAVTATQSSMQGGAAGSVGQRTRRTRGEESRPQGHRPGSQRGVRVPPRPEAWRAECGGGNTAASASHRGRECCAPQQGGWDRSRPIQPEGGQRAGRPPGTRRRPRADETEAVKTPASGRRRTPSRAARGKHTAAGHEGQRPSKAAIGTAGARQRAIAL